MAETYAHVDEFIYEITLREDFYNLITKDAAKFATFDAILSEIRDAYRDKIQAACDEIFEDNSVFIF